MLGGILWLWETTQNYYVVNLELLRILTYTVFFNWFVSYITLEKRCRLIIGSNTNVCHIVWCNLDNTGSIINNRITAGIICYLSYKYFNEVYILIFQ